LRVVAVSDFWSRVPTRGKADESRKVYDGVGALRVPRDFVGSDVGSMKRELRMREEWQERIAAEEQPVDDYHTIPSTEKRLAEGRADVPRTSRNQDVYFSDPSQSRVIGIGSIVDGQP